VWRKETEALLGMLLNREYTLAWTKKQLVTITKMVEPIYCIRSEYHHNVWQNLECHPTRKVIPIEMENIAVRVRQGLFKPKQALLEMLTS